MHNTVRIAGIEINDLPKDNLFRLPSQDKPKVLSWSTEESADRLSACHYGYSKLSPAIIHLRTVVLRKTRGIITVTDRFLGDGAHTAEWHIPLDPRARARLEDSRQVIIEVGSMTVGVSLDWDPDRIEIVPSQYSESYGQVEPNTTIHILMNSTSDRIYTWEIQQLLS